MLLIPRSSAAAKQKALFRAASCGDIGNVRLALELGAAPDCLNASGNSPLCVAVARGQLDVVKLLLSKGASVESVVGSSAFPLHEACRKGYLEIASILVEHGAGVNTSSGPEFSETPLHLAARNSHSDLVKLLLEHGADASARDFQGCTPLCEALQGGSLTCSRMLLDAGANVIIRKVKKGNRPIEIAIRGNHSECLELLIENIVQRLRRGDYSEEEVGRALEAGFLDSVERDCLDATKVFWSHRHILPPKVIDIDKALDILCSSSQNMELATFLLDCGASAKGYSVANCPLVSCLKRPHHHSSVQFLKLLQERGAVVTRDVRQRYCLQCKSQGARDHIVAAYRNNQMISFCMGTHRRLGSESLVRLLVPDVMAKIFRQLKDIDPPWSDE